MARLLFSLYSFSNLQTRTQGTSAPPVARKHPATPWPGLGRSTPTALDAGLEREWTQTLEGEFVRFG